MSISSATCIQVSKHALIGTISVVLVPILRRPVDSEVMVNIYIYIYIYI